MKINRGLLTVAAALTAMAPLATLSPIQERGEAPRRSYRKNPKINRSRHWPHAESYADARAMSPFPNRPVR